MGGILWNPRFNSVLFNQLRNGFSPPFKLVCVEFLSLTTTYKFLYMHIIGLTGFFPGSSGFSMEEGKTRAETLGKR